MYNGAVTKHCHLSARRFHVWFQHGPFSVAACAFVGSLRVSSFSQSKDMHVMSICNSNLPVGVNASVDVCLSLSVRLTGILSSVYPAPSL